MTYRVALIKILPDVWVEDFLDGNLYLNTNAYFGNIDETDDVRFDRYDGVHESRQVKEIAIADEQGNWVPIGGIQNPVTLRTSRAQPFPAA